eukprot:68504-Prorocentrum_minimum.AAC.4
MSATSSCHCLRSGPSVVPQFVFYPATVSGLVWSGPLVVPQFVFYPATVSGLVWSVGHAAVCFLSCHRLGSGLVRRSCRSLFFILPPSRVWSGPSAVLRFVFGPRSAPPALTAGALAACLTAQACAVARQALEDRAMSNKDDPDKFRSDLMNVAKTTLSSKILTQVRTPSVVRPAAQSATVGPTESARGRPLPNTSSSK